jgi:uncharacterized protein YjbJ (UPF0337 family)
MQGRQTRTDEKVPSDTSFNTAVDRSAASAEDAAAMALPTGTIAIKRRFTSTARMGRRVEMDWNRVEGNWKQFKGKVKEKWGRLTDDDLDVIAGHRDQLEGKIQERYGVARDQIRKDVDDWYNAQKW